MKKPARKDLALTTTTVRTLARTLDEHALEAVAGGVLNASVAKCYTRPQGGCP